MVLVILDDKGDAVSGSFDIGEAYIDSPRSPGRNITLRNTSNDTLTLLVETLDQIQIDDNVMTVKIIMINEVPESALAMLAEYPQQDLVIPPQSEISAMLCVCYNGANGSNKAKGRKARSRFTRSNCQLHMRYHLGNATHFEEIHLHLTAFFCESILAVDEKDIEFDSCVEGNIYVRDLQIWNRSECELLYHIAPLNPALPLPIAFSDFESGRTLALYESIRLSAFSSQRIRVTLHAKTVCDISRAIRLENENNVSNLVVLNCHISVTSKDNNGTIRLESEGGVRIGADGQPFDMGQCYFGVDKVYRVWVRNTGDRAIEFNMTSDSPAEISFDSLDSIRRSGKVGAAGMKGGDDDTETMGNSSATPDPLTHRSTAIDLPRRVERATIVSTSYGTTCQEDLDHSRERMFRGSHALDRVAAQCGRRGEYSEGIKQKKKHIPHAKSFESGRHVLERDSRKLITIRFNPVPPGAPVSGINLSHYSAETADGSLMRKALKLLVLWKYKRSTGEQHDSHRKLKIFSHCIQCRSRCCVSIISVTPSSLDLGECIVGQLKSATFTVKNESDMAALVLPFVDSKSLEILERELSIPPRSFKSCHVEYVARTADAFYSNKVLVMNVFNSHCNVDIEVRAKNVDLNGILELSNLYQIFTQNQKLQTQVYFDKCLWNTPNLKTFCIQNMGSEPLQFELTTSSPSTVQIYIWNKDLQMADERIGQALKKWGGNMENETKLLSSTRRLLNRTVDDEAIRIVSSSFPSSGRDSKLGDLTDWARGGTYRAEEGSDEKRSFVGADSERGQRNSVDRDIPDIQTYGSRFIQLMGSDGFPFSVLDSADSIGATGDGTLTDPGLDRSGGVDNVTLIHNCYEEFRRDMEAAKHLLPVCTNDIQKRVVIPPDKSFDFVVVLTPDRSINRIVDIEQQIIQEEVRLNLLMSHADDSVFLKSLPVRAYLFESEMMVGQKNINFGKIIVGEVSTRGVSISNKSDFALIYNISKSGSISSGFLKVLNGRRGVIAAMSSKVVEFEFRPKLPGQFEEALTIFNALNSKDSHVVVIKATILKSDLFNLLPDESPSSVSEEVSSSDMNVRHETDVMIVVSGLQQAYMRNKMLESSAQLVPLPIFYLGVVPSATPSTCSFSFRMQNPSAKQRQLVLALEDMCYSTDMNAASCTIQCGYVVVNRDCGSHESSAGISPEDRKRLLDKLEGYNQKLKIAIRKGKLDKERKYLEKIADVKKKLEVESAIMVPSESSEALEIIGSSAVSVEGGRQGEMQFTLNPNEIITVRVDVDILLIASGGGLTCCMGALRVYEGRNEDDVKYVFFGTGCTARTDVLPQCSLSNAALSFPLVLDVDTPADTVHTTPSATSPMDTAEVDMTAFPIVDAPVVAAAEMSSIGSKKHISFGDVALDRVDGQVVTVPITNTHPTDELIYHAIVNAGSLAACGQAEITDNQRGTISPQQSIDIKLRFLPLRIGKFECSILVVNALQETDFVNVMLTANVSYRQSHFVLYPELLCDEMGKHNKLELGLLQTPMLEHAVGHVEFKFPLKIVNVYSEVIFVSAVSNLKRQCFVYCDDECTILANSWELKPFVTSTLYILLKPSNLSNDDADIGREFRGGIRLMFFQNPHSRRGLASEQSADAESDHAPDKKLFESSIVFNAVIGRSKFRINLKAPRFRVIPLLPSTTNRMIRGFFEVENISPVFPAAYTLTSMVGEKYAFSSTAAVRSNGIIEKNTFRFVITKGQCGTIEPGQCAIVEYSLNFNDIAGLAVIPLTLLNLSTHESQKFNISYFFDSTVVHSYVPETESAEEENVMKRSIQACPRDSNLLFSRNVYVSRYPDLSFIFPLWAVPTDLAASDEVKSNTVPDGYKTTDALLTCGADRILFQWELHNPRNVVVRLSPVSNIPVKISCETINEEALSSIPIVATKSTALGGGNMLRKSKARSFLGSDQQRTMVSIPADLTAQGFTICGDPVSILPYQSILVCVQSDSGRCIDSEHFGAISASLSGVIAFVSAAQTLESFFNPNPTKQTPYSPSAADCVSVQPVLSYLPVTYSLVIPILKVLTPRIHLGIVRQYNPGSFFVEIENPTDDSIPFRVENVPGWIHLIATTEGSVVIPFSKRNGARGSALMTPTLHACAKKVTRLEFGLHFPRNLASSIISHTLRLKNLAASSPQAPSRRDFVNIEVVCEYDATMALVVKDARGLKYSTREVTNNQFINIEKVGLPRSLHFSRPVSSFSVQNTTASSLRVVPAIFASPTFTQLVNISLLSGNQESVVGQHVELPAGGSCEFALAVAPVMYSHISPDRMEEIELETARDVDDESSSGEDERDSDYQVASLTGALDSILIGQISFSYGPAASNDPATSKQEPGEDIVIDVIGTLLPLSTIAVKDSLGNELSALTVEMEMDQHGMPVWHGRSPRGHSYFLHNLTDEDLNFRVKCSILRFGKYESNIEKLREVPFDKDGIGIVCSTSKGFLPGGEEYNTTISLSVGRVEVDDNWLSDFDSLQEEYNRSSVSRGNDDVLQCGDDILAEAYIAIYDECNPVHQARLCRVYVKASASTTNAFIEPEDVLSRSSHRLENDSSSMTFSAPPTLRVRGVSPCSTSHLLYEVNVGQQVCQPDEMEWTVSLENTSLAHRLLYKISTLSQSDMRWLSVMQSGGGINEGGMASVVLHFNRSRLGIFSTYLMIENMSDMNDMLIVRCSMEVVQDWTKMTSESEDDKINMLHKYFMVKTTAQALGSDFSTRLLSWNSGKSLTDRGRDAGCSSSSRASRLDQPLSQHLTVDFGEVYVGHLYTRRSFSIVNTADIALDFHVSSTFPTTELGFSLTPVSPRMCTRITVMPGETRVVHLLYRPYRSIAEFDSNCNAPLIINGMVFVSCKLVKNHHETITIRAQCFYPKFSTSISASLRDDTEAIGILQMNVRNTFSCYFTPSLSASIDTPTDYIWHTNIVMSVKNMSSVEMSEPLIITVYSAMVCFVLDIYRAEDDRHIQLKQWCHEVNEGRGATADITLQAGEEVFIKVSLIPDIDGVLRKFETKRGSTSSGYHIGAEDHFMIYNRRNPSERCRVPVRLLIPSNADEVGTLDRDNMPSTFPHSIEVRVSFAALEGIIAAFLKEFASFWGEVIDRELSNATESTMNGWEFDLNSSTTDMPWTEDNLLSIQDRTPPDIASILDRFFGRLRGVLRITESGIYMAEENTALSPPTSALSEDLIAIGTRFTELFLHFHAITDMLVLHTMRQSSYGHEIMTPARTGLPVVRLALLLYIAVFRHPIFTYYAPSAVMTSREDDHGSLPGPLLPFCKLPIYYMAFSYDASGENSLLLDVRDNVIRLAAK